MGKAEAASRLRSFGRWEGEAGLMDEITIAKPEYFQRVPGSDS